MSLLFAKPSLRRAIWSIVAVAVACDVVVSSAYVVGAIVTGRNDSDPTTTGEYVQLAAMFLTFWSPILLLTFWYLTLPVVITIGLLIASVRRETSASTRRTSTGQ